MLAGPSLVTAARAAVLLADVPDLAARARRRVDRVRRRRRVGALDRRRERHVVPRPGGRRPGRRRRRGHRRARRSTPPAGWRRCGSPTGGCCARTPASSGRGPGWSARSCSPPRVSAPPTGRCSSASPTRRSGRRSAGPIGSYQAVKHLLVDAWVGVDQLRSLVWWAAWAADNAPEEFPLAASAAKAYAARVFEQAAETVIQVHGGIGFTWEHDAHLYWRRAKVDRLLLGDEAEHLDAVARLAVAGALGLMRGPHRAPVRGRGRRRDHHPAPARPAQRVHADHGRRARRGGRGRRTPTTPSGWSW